MLERCQFIPFHCNSAFTEICGGLPFPARSGSGHSPCVMDSSSRLKGDQRMGMTSLKDLYIEELGDLYDAEKQMIRTLARLAEAAHAPELKETLTKHCEES